VKLKLKLTSEKNKDTGLVIVLCLLLGYLHSHNPVLIWISVACILVSILFPIILKPVSVVWYGLSEIMGMVVSRILLSVIFFCIITPIGLIRRLFTKKQLLTERWKKDRESVFVERNVQFSSSDIENPF
jgi:hypothetical protein